MTGTAGSTRGQRTRSLRARAAAAVGGLLVAGLAVGGCDPGSGAGCGLWAFLFRLVSGITTKGDPATTRYARAGTAKAQRIVADPDTLTFVAPADVPAPNFATVTLPYDLVAPFRVECTVGLCDPALYPAPTAVFGLGVVERTGAERRFSADCSRVAGITATASFGTPAPHAFTGAERLDLAIQHDGTNLIAFAREHASAGAWTEVSRTPVAATGPFLPRFAARNFEPGQMVSYYSLRVLTNAPYAPGQVTPQHQAVRAMAEAVNALADGAGELADATPDAGAAALRMQAANQFVEQAVSALDAPASPGKTSPAAHRAKKARRAALKAARTVTQAITKLDAGGTAQSAAAIKRVASAMLVLVQAGDQILPDDLRAAIGGLTFRQLRGK